MQGASAYIQTINPELLGSISYEHNPAQAVNTYLNSSAGDINKVHEAVVASNHLGNVQATLSDKRYVKKQYLSATDSLRKSFAASVSSMYDYYPFGMPMLERSTSDTGTQTAYVSQVVYSPFLFNKNLIRLYNF
jgi:hypothetical protein